MRKHGYSEGIYGGLRLESVTPMALKCSIRNMNYIISRQKYGGLRRKSTTPMALFPTNHMLTQGSLHYRLATLGYQKRNTYGVE